jgi:predicted transcriptional regulator
MRKKAAFTVAEVAELTGFSRQTVTRLFERERGVLVMERPEAMHKQRYLRNKPAACIPGGSQRACSGHSEGVEP